MPNGGMKPCCQTCQWATLSEKIGRVGCNRHQLSIFLSLSTFCADLAKDELPGLAEFITQNQFETETIYQWIEVSYQDPNHPSLPMYYQEPVALASITDYALWDEGHAIKVSQSLHEQKRKQLIHQLSD